MTLMEVGGVFLQNARALKPEELRPVAGHISVALDKLVLVWGGYYASPIVDEQFNEPKDLLVYDSVFNKWFCFETTGDLPQQNSGACAVLIDLTLYIFGGFCDRDAVTRRYDYARLFALDLRTLTWRQLEPTNFLLPTVRHKLVGWHYGTRLYYFGGYGPEPEDSLPSIANARYLRSNSSDYISDNYLYSGGSWNKQLLSFDLENHSWQLHPMLGDCPSGRAAHSIVHLPEKSKVIIFGGRLAERRMNDMYMLDLPSMMWSKIDTTDGPCGRSWHTTVAVDSNHILLFGGFSQDAVPLGDSWYFDMDRCQWTQTSLITAKNTRLWHTAVAIDRSCYIHGGCKTSMWNSNTVRYANDILVIPTAPRSLLDQCLRYVDSCQRLYKRHLAQLPITLQAKLQFIASENPQQSVKTPLDLLRI